MFELANLIGSDLDPFVKTSLTDVFRMFDSDGDRIFDVFPPCNYSVDKNTGNATIELALAGYNKENLSVNIEDNSLKISGKTSEKSEEKEADNVKYFRKKIHCTSFEKSIPFTKDYDLEKSDISFNNGLLKIRVPLKEKKDLPIKTLEIK